MRRFFLPYAEFQAGHSLELTPEVLKHIRSVLRLSVGAEVELLDGCGAIARCRLEILTAKEGRASVLDVRHMPPPPLQIELIQGTAKGDKLDLILQKGTELGASRFVLSSMERSVGKLKEDRMLARVERWQRIVQEAARQCGQPHLPGIATAQSLDAALAGCCGELKLMLWEEETQPLPAMLPAEVPATISLLVGPEGGLTPGEAMSARSSGFVGVRLGPRILRTETAGLAIISILQYLYGDLATGAMNIQPSFEGKDSR